MIGITFRPPISRHVYIDCNMNHSHKFTMFRTGFNKRLCKFHIIFTDNIVIISFISKTIFSYFVTFITIFFIIATIMAIALTPTILRIPHSSECVFKSPYFCILKFQILILLFLNSNKSFLILIKV